MLKIGTYNNQQGFRSGEEIAGKVLWLRETPPKRIQIKLLWRVLVAKSARITQVDCIVVNRPDRLGEHDFRFDLPESPYSYVGSMSSLEWVVEVAANDEKEELIFAYSPVGSVLRLNR